MKLTLSLIVVIMKYQGRDGKYYTIQKVSVYISAFFSLFFTGLLSVLNLFRVKTNLFIIFLFLWPLIFLIHYSWFLKRDKSKLILHYTEYKKCLMLFVILMFASIALYVY
jgi:hypothetical protein